MSAARRLAKIIPLPGAAAEPVRQPVRRGRFPAVVTPIRRGYLLKLDATMRAKAAPKAQQSLKDVESFYLTCKRIHDSALNELLIARQLASREVKS